MRKEEVSAYEEAIRLFKTIEDYENAKEKIKECNQKIKHLEEEEFTKSKKKIKKLTAIASVLVLVITFLLFFSKLAEYIGL